MKKILLAIALLLVAGLCFSQPSLSVSVRATGTGSIFYVYVNVKNTAAVSTGANNATNVTVSCPLPAGATFLSANFDGSSDGTNVTWNFPVLGGLNAVTPSFSFSISSGSATIGVNTVTATADGGISANAPSVASGAITKTYTAPGPIVVIATSGNDATALTNLLPDGSTHASYPFKTFTSAMDQVKANAKLCQTVIFRPGMYDKTYGIHSSVGINTGNGWTTGTFDGLTITGGGATLTGGSTAGGYFLLVSGESIKDLTINKMLFSEYNNGATPASVLSISDCDGLVINECKFYKCGSQRPVNFEFGDIQAVATTINGSTFSSNPGGVETPGSGAIEYELNTGASATYANWNNISNSLFTCNARLGDGAAVSAALGGDYVTTVLNFSKCAFQGNTQSATSGNGGGAIYIASSTPSSSVGSVNIYNTTFLDNVATSLTSPGYGGQISVRGNILNINGGSITNGGATSGSLRGGGLGARGATSSSIYPEVLINNLTVSGNYVTGSTNAYGGIFVEGATLAYAANTSITSNTSSPDQTNITPPGFTITAGTAPAVPSSSRRAYCPVPLPAPLAVKIDNFEAKAQNCTIRLIWELSNENTFKSADLQKSEDGIHFTSISTLKIHRGSYFDKNVGSALYYRLKITEQEGLVTYSAVKKVNASCADDFSVALMGNPVHHTVGVKFYSSVQQPAEYIIEDIAGRSFVRKSLTLPAGLFTINESLTHLARGVYYLKVMVPGKPLQAIKFMKQ